MILEECIDKGILFKQLIQMAESGLEVYMKGGGIRVGNSPFYGEGYGLLSYDCIESAMAEAHRPKE